MSVAYVDTSCLVAVAFGERGASAVVRRLERADELLSSNLLEAELRAAFVRESVDGGDDLLTWLSWVLPNRTLSDEITTILSCGYLRGADLWHVATALYVAEDPAEIAFITRDERQGSVAKALGFRS